MHRESMRKIAITGGDGFRAFHMRAFLLPFEREGQVEVVPLSEDVMNDPQVFAEALKGVDVVVPLAGMNRGDDEVLYENNIGLARSLINACERASVTPHIVFASTTHHERDTAYGRSKRETEKIFKEWGEKKSAPVSIIIFPNLFGEFGKPYYNSVVATFCHELAYGKESIINAENAIELLHAHSMASQLYEAITSVRVGEFRSSGIVIKVSELYEKLRLMTATYRGGTLPDTETPLDVELFMTLHSHLFPLMFPQTLEAKSDTRGSLYTISKSNRKSETFFSTTHPGQVRGDHYHFRKMERFCVIQGEGEILIRRLFSDQVMRYPVSGSVPVVIDMPTYSTHALRNSGSIDMLTLFCSNEQFNVSDPDTFFETTELSEK